MRYVVLRGSKLPEGILRFIPFIQKVSAESTLQKLTEGIHPETWNWSKDTKYDWQDYWCVVEIDEPEHNEWGEVCL